MLRLWTFLYLLIAKAVKKEGGKSFGGSTAVSPRSSHTPQYLLLSYGYFVKATDTPCTSSSWRAHAAPKTLSTLFRRRDAPS